MSDEHSGPRRNFLGSGNDEFECGVCGARVFPLAAGGFRNHCPECLWSRHVDEVPGDRQAECRGYMEPVEVRGTSAGGWVVLHRCEACGFERPNKVTLDDPRQPDSWEALQRISGG